MPHTHEKEETQRNVLISVSLNLLITIAEIVGGILSRSLLLLSDSFHNLSDTMSLALTFFTMRISKKERTEKFTFGFKRAEIISAFVNSSFLLVVAALIIREAISRFINIESVNISIMLPVALIGLFANFFSVLLLHHHTDSLNVRSSYLHLLADTLSSVVVVIGALIMWKFHFYYFDPIFSILVAIYMGYEAFEILKESTHILMEGAPADVNLNDIEKDILSIPGVENVHHVHIWMLDDESKIFEAHVNVEKMDVTETKKIREEIEDLLNKKYGINHTNIQFECGEHIDDGLIKKDH